MRQSCEAELQGRAEVAAELEEEDEAVLAAAALDAMRLLGKPDCNLPIKVRLGTHALPHM